MNLDGKPNEENVSYHKPITVPNNVNLQIFFFIETAEDRNLKKFTRSEVIVENFQGMLEENQLYGPVITKGNLCSGSETQVSRGAKHRTAYFTCEKWTSRKARGVADTAVKWE